MWTYYLLLFVSSGCIMTLELVAGRLVAPFIGVSLYTWTGIIGACLTGMSFGSLFGGWLADRGEPNRWLSRLFLTGAALVAALLMFQPLIRLTAKAVMALNLSPLVGIFALSMLLFGIPCFFMAAISPLVYKLALPDRSRVGRTVGRLSASGIAGSIVGTYATGFWLIPSFGTQAIVLGVTAMMGLLGAYTLTWSISRRTITAAVLVAAPWLVTAAAPVLAQNVCKEESAYYCIRVVTEEREGLGPVKLMRLDYLVHSGIRLEKPDKLWYEYEQVAAWILANRQQPAAQTLFLGGGGYVLPHWVERHYPEAGIDVVEIDPAVTRVALTELVPEAKRIRSYNQDARMALMELPPEQKYDVIFGDVFNDLSVPYHLTTLEFARLVRQRLNEDGLYVLNIIDQKQEGRFLGAMTRTLEEVFPYVYALPGSGNKGGRGPQLVVASFEEIPWLTWEQHESTPTFDVLPMAVKGEYPVLTDNYVPTDQLLLPIFSDRWKL